MKNTNSGQIPAPAAPEANQHRLFSAGLRRLLLAVAIFGFAASSSFAEPASGPKMSNGYSVDWCLHWGADCGKPADDEYCRRSGYPAGSVSHPGFGMHTFRRLNMSWRQEVGATPFEAMKAAGHSKPLTTWEYTITDAQREREHVDRMLDRISSAEAKLMAEPSMGPVQ
jgi:hypothetical protein